MACNQTSAHVFTVNALPDTSDKSPATGTFPVDTNTIDFEQIIAYFNLNTTVAELAEDMEDYLTTAAYVYTDYNASTFYNGAINHIDIRMEYLVSYMYKIPERFHGDDTFSNVWVQVNMFSESTENYRNPRAVSLLSGDELNEFMSKSMQG
ncbi:hypothetical protein GCM10007377_15170 [Galliscardovia ingluviei]|uniref:Uncharacterized protein n=1 Tax=Galliscardovia ingluviei TaxID=1769422 RepID=A0A8J3EZH8_9BIFI|nr:hypothetical protein [Galliscardovia ingluviei]GGI15292.1 hypothetical protein GCM10007377_15170 [Galliscardovia ingluviei]